MPIEMVWSVGRDEAFDAREFASGILDRAKENLRHDGYVQAAVFIVTANEVQCYSVAFSGYEEKEATYNEVVKKAHELNANLIITLNDAFLGDKDKYETGNYEWGQVAADPKGECIFVSISGPGLENWTLEMEYRRQPSGVSFSSPVEERKSSVGFLGNWSKKGQRVN
jgi:hypothetical protein